MGTVPAPDYRSGLRFDNDTVTGSTHAAPRVGFLFALTKDSKTLLKGGVGMFYDRVPLMIPDFREAAESDSVHA